MQWLNRDVTKYHETPVHWLDWADIGMAAEAKAEKEMAKPKPK